MSLLGRKSESIVLEEQYAINYAVKDFFLALDAIFDVGFLVLGVGHGDRLLGFLYSLLPR
jgi:hypothetical protein